MYVFHDILIFGKGMQRSFRRFVLLLCMPPRTPTVMMVRGATCHPWALIASIIGLNLSVLGCMACSAYRS